MVVPTALVYACGVGDNTIDGGADGAKQEASEDGAASDGLTFADGPHCQTPSAVTLDDAGPVCTLVGLEHVFWQHCNQGEVCLMPGPEWGSGACESSDSGAPKTDASFVVECTQPNDCANAQICCLNSATLSVDVGCENLYRTAPHAGGTTCSLTCSGYTLCATTADCSQGMCLPIVMGQSGLWLGICQ